MAPKAVPAAELQRRIEAIERHGGNVKAAAAELGMPRQTLHSSLELKNRILKPQPIPPLGIIDHPGRIDLTVEDGIVLVGSDAHIWPGDPTPAMRAFLWACRKLKPKAVILNGDLFDGASISRHARIGWERRPTVAEELEAVQERLRDIRLIIGKNTAKIWNLGNHDQRLETAIANTMPELELVKGVHLKDHFPEWSPSWSTWINDEVVVKHRLRAGVHATWNNTIYAGKTIVTGHLHALRVTPFTDYAGTRWGVDTGCLATPYSRQFIDYTEAGPVQWRPGFAVLTFRQYRLLWPELVHVIDSHTADFRGELIEF